MKYSYCLLALLCLSLTHAPAQKVRPLSVGDSVPDILFSHFTNAPFSKSRLSDWKTKLVILDFFATSCGACIHSLPRLDSLQQKLGDKLQILVVCYEPMETIRNFLQKNAIAKRIRLPFITGDTLLKKIFEHYYIPHEVWIKDKQVKAVTLAEVVTASNITDMYDGKAIKAGVKKDNMEFNPAVSLRSQMERSDTSLFIQQSLLTRYYPGVGSRRGTDRTANTKRFYFINWNMLSLFQYAWQFDANRIILDTKDSSLITERRTDPSAWRKYNLYCYEATLPVASPDSSAKELLKATLNTALAVEGAYETRQVNCWILSHKDRSAGPPRANSAPELRTNSSEDSTFFLGHTIDVFIASCNGAPTPSPGKPVILNETGISYPVDFRIPTEALQNILLLKQALASYGLDLLPEKRNLKVFVIRDRIPVSRQ